MVSCCSNTKRNRSCKRKDGKTFKLPRKFSKKKCTTRPVRGHTMRASCAPYKYCKTKKNRFLYHPDNPDKSFDVYVDKNPKDTIPIKFTTVDDVRSTIQKLEKLYKSGKYPHKRIWQVGMIMKVRLEAIKKNHPNVKSINKRVRLAQKYFKFLGKRTKFDEEARKKSVFKI